MCKIITTKSPIALYDSITSSPRNDENLIVLKSSSQKESCFHTVSTYWNSLIKRLGIPNPNIIVIPMLKQNLKNFFLHRQEIGDPLILNRLQENNDI